MNRMMVIANILRSQLAVHNKDSLIRRCVSASRFGTGALYKASLSTRANDSGNDRDGNIKSAKIVYIVGGMGSGKVCVSCALLLTSHAIIFNHSHVLCVDIQWRLLGCNA